MLRPAIHEIDETIQEMLQPSAADDSLDTKLETTAAEARLCSQMLCFCKKPLVDTAARLAAVEHPQQPAEAREAAAYLAGLVQTLLSTVQDLIARIKGALLHVCAAG